MKEVYIQTASFSRIIKDEFDKCIKKVAEAGYTGVEFFQGIYGGYSPTELKSFLNGLGLDILGAHVNLDATDEQLEYLPATGSRYMICPGIHISSHDDALRAAEELNRAGEKAKAVGLKYGYHNHNNDFNIFNGEMAIDTLIKNTDPSLVGFELDVGWAWRAGVNAEEFIRKYPGRFPLLHVKESSRALRPDESFGKMFANVKRDSEGKPIFTDEMKAKMEEFQKINCKLGDGLINMPALSVTANAQGTEAYVVEREYAYTGDIFTSVKEDLDYLRTI